MPTIIDSLIIELSLDAKDFSKGAKEAADAFLKTRDEAVRHTKEIEKQVGEKLRDAFRETTRHVLEFVAALAAANSIQQFTQNTIEAGVSLKSMSEALQMPVQRLSAIQHAIEAVEGSSTNAGAALRTLDKARTDYQTGGYEGKGFTDLGIDLGSARNAEEVLHRAMTSPRFLAADAAHKLHFLEGLGIGGTGVDIYGATHSWKQMQAAISEAIPNAMTQGQADAAERIHKELSEASDAARALGAAIFEHAEAPITALLGHLKTLIEVKGEAFNEWVSQGLVDFNAWLDSDRGKSDRKQFIDDMKWMRDEAGDLKDALGGWRNATIALFSLWLGMEVYKVAAAIGAISLAASGGGVKSGGGAGGVFGGGFGTLATVVIAGAVGLGLWARSAWPDATAESRAKDAEEESRRRMDWAYHGGGGFSMWTWNQVSKGRGLPSDWEARLAKILAIPLPGMDAPGSAGWGGKTEITINGGQTIGPNSAVPVFVVNQQTFSPAVSMSPDSGSSGGYDASRGPQGAADASGGWPGEGPHDLVDGVRDYAGLKLAGAQATGGGPVQQGLLDLARHQQEAEGGHFSSLNDLFHRGRPSAHNQGRAFDEVLPGGDYEAARGRVRAYLLGLGMDPRDFWIEPGTRDHLHVQFNNAAAAKKFDEKYRARAGAPAAPAFTPRPTIPATGAHASPNLYTPRPQAMRNGGGSVQVGSIAIHAGDQRAAMSPVEKRMRASLTALRADVGLV